MCSRSQLAWLLLTESAPSPAGAGCGRRRGQRLPWQQEHSGLGLPEVQNFERGFFTKMLMGYK